MTGSLTELLSDLEAAGTVFTLSRGTVHIDAPVGVVTPEQFEQLKGSKPELVKLIRGVSSVWLHEPRGLIGCGFPGRKTKTPPPEILDTRTQCRCGRFYVLPELRSITGGVCWPCHEGN